MCSTPAASRAATLDTTAKGEDLARRISGLAEELVPDIEVDRVRACPAWVATGSRGCPEHVADVDASAHSRAATQPQFDRCTA